MFHLHRRYLVHKIWKARAICIGDQVSEKTFGFLKEAVYRYFAAFDVSSLLLFVKILTEQEDLCFHTTSTLFEESKSGIQRQRYLLARVWRWPDLKENHELKHIQGRCERKDMGDCMCVNPFHFSRIVKRDIPYTNFQDTKETDYEDSGLSCTGKEAENLWEETPTTDPSCRRQRGKTKPWVKLAYWEGNVRVGTMYQGYDRTINIYESLAKGNKEGLCLTELERTHEMNQRTKVVFNNIGDGVQITLEDGDIWIHNRSPSPVFINGELLQTLRRARTPRVEKLPSGYALKVFSCDDMPRNVNKRRNEPHCLRVSFVKGFGSGYKRQYITNCPCWVEMFFFVPES